VRIEQPLPALLLLSLLFGGCTTPNVPTEPSQALPASDSAFGRSIQAQATPHQGQSGFRLLSDSAEAFNARAELVRNAQSSLDL
jgi:putative cardiolipin synthase